jgi:hypothetical protein
MGRGARSVTRPIFNWLIVRDFAIHSQLVWTLHAPHDTCRPTKIFAKSNLPKLWHETAAVQWRLVRGANRLSGQLDRNRDNMRSIRAWANYSVFQCCAKDREKGSLRCNRFSSFTLSAASFVRQIHHVL